MKKRRGTKEWRAMGMGQGISDEGLLPKGESLRKAVLWLSTRVAEGHPVSLKLVEEAALRFDLSPIQEQLLLKEWLEGRAQSSEQEGEGALPE
jgi:hypothetical protein